MFAKLRRLYTRFCQVEQHVGSLNYDMAQVREDVGSLNHDMAQVREDVRSLNHDMARVREDVGSLNHDMPRVSENLGGLLERIKEIQTQISKPPMTETARLNVGLEARSLDGVSMVTHSDADIVSECIRQYRIWEAEETSFFLDHIRPGQTVIDLGANIGYYTCIASRLVGPAGHVIAFEPNDKNYELLTKNIALNGMTNVSSFKAIVMDRAGVGVLTENTAGNNGAHMAIPVEHAEFAGRSIHPAITLDDLHEAKIGRVDFIKMDTQGSEPLIFKGGQRLISDNRKHLTMVVEFSPIWIKYILGIRPTEFLRELQGYGFHISYINQMTCLVEPLTDADRLVDILMAADGVTWPEKATFADLLLTPAA